MAAHFDLIDMQLMVNVAGARSMTKGAERSFLSLPAASNRVKNLEQHLGTALFYRNSQGVTLTPSGEAFIRHARIILRQLEHLRGDIREYASGVKGHIRVFANTTAMNEFMPTVLARYLGAHPDVNVELRERLSYLIVKAVAEGTADIGITAQGSGGENIEFLPYRTDRLVLVTHRDHPLAGHDAVGFDETLAWDYVGLSEASAIHSFLLQAADDLGRVLRFRVEVSNFEAACRMIAAHVGIGIIPESAARRYVQGLPLAVISLNDEWSLRRLHICVRQFDKLPVFAKDLVSLLVKDAAVNAQDTERAGVAAKLAADPATESILPTENTP
ncbi:LysR substrate-binding domain-containing protein [Allopusillimonas ginsengisoli]|uniref:LysR substrate-binding domain-containing protein n=1 Tax=Allopusillimonas ginsengisoli TaxID=453575 RepID=UPI00102000BF|nr:LysR substrate-binding domain-containing protein [Allopusillimonas ginsengisoli]TEA71851.1 LysR family transcriptional regulator [Allopusillimonas ginsengisoli]